MWPIVSSAIQYSTVQVVWLVLRAVAWWWWRRWWWWWWWWWRRGRWKICLCTRRHQLFTRCRRFLCTSTPAWQCGLTAVLSCLHSLSMSHHSLAPRCSYWHALQFQSQSSRVIICPIAYSMGQIITPVCVCVSFCVSVCGHSHASHFLIDFHQNLHRCKNPKSENEFVGVNIAPPLPHFAPKIPILGKEVLKIHANIKILYVP